MNWRKDIFQTIVNKLKPLKTNGDIKYIDLDKGQFNEPKKSHPMAKPAVLIGIQSSGDMEHLTHQYVQGKDAIVTALVVLDNRNLSFQDAQSFNDSIAILDLIQKIVETLTFTCGDSFTELHYKNDEKQANQFDGLQRYLITFSTQLYFQLNIN